MRAAFSLLALVIVAAIVLSLAKKQATALKPAAAGASAAATGTAGAALPAPKAVGQQVQNSIDEAARKAAEAASAATN
ncbi:hypothetical protein ACS5PN_07185 [Roseateles sp. NT4]|uniref:hypothetical protein n=1 Tax=Roseateles sp. NT4 TaxID=3453715 RepID=UPI003EE9572A